MQIYQRLSSLFLFVFPFAKALMGSRFFIPFKADALRGRVNHARTLTCKCKLKHEQSHTKELKNTDDAVLVPPQPGEW